MRYYQIILVFSLISLSKQAYAQTDSLKTFLDLSQVEDSILVKNGIKLYIDARQTIQEANKYIENPENNPIALTNENVFFLTEMFKEVQRMNSYIFSFDILENDDLLNLLKDDPDRRELIAQAILDSYTNPRSLIIVRIRALEKQYFRQYSQIPHAKNLMTALLQFIELTKLIDRNKHTEATTLKDKTIVLANVMNSLYPDLKKSIQSFNEFVINNLQCNQTLNTSL